MKLPPAVLALACLSVQVIGNTLSNRNGSYDVAEHLNGEKHALLQDIVRKMALRAIYEISVDTAR